MYSFEPAASCIRDTLMEPLYILRGNMTAIHSLQFDIFDTSEYLYASTGSGIIHKWNLQTCREEDKLIAGEEACLSVKCLDHYLISQLKGGNFKVYQKEEDSITNTKCIINCDYWGFCKIEITKSKHLLVPVSSSLVKVFNLEGTLINMLSYSGKNLPGEVMVLKYFTLFESEFCFVLYENGCISLFQVNGVEISNFKITTDCPMALDFDGKTLGIVGTSGSVIVGFHLTSDKKIVKWKETVITNPGVSCVSIRPDNKIFATGCWDSNIRLFSMKSMKLLVVLQSHKETIHDICYSPFRVEAWNAEWLLAAAGKDGRITLWNLY